MVDVAISGDNPDAVDVVRVTLHNVEVTMWTKGDALRGDERDMVSNAGGLLVIHQHPLWESIHTTSGVRGTQYDLASCISLCVSLLYTGRCTW